MSQLIAAYLVNFGKITSDKLLAEKIISCYSILNRKLIVEADTYETLITGLSMQAFHGISNAYVFTKGYKNNFQLQEFSEKDQNMSKMITRIITNFVKHG